MTVDMRFFQAAATALPTLAIAVSVSGKFLDVKTYLEPDPALVVDDKESMRKQRDKILHAKMKVHNRVMLTAFFFFVFFVAGEKAALSALLFNDPTSGRAAVTSISLVVCVMILGVAVLVPRLKSATDVSNDLSNERKGYTCKSERSSPQATAEVGTSGPRSTADCWRTCHTVLNNIAIPIQRPSPA